MILLASVANSFVDLCGHTVKRVSQIRRSALVLRPVTSD